jgi:hypothetical protein
MSAATQSINTPEIGADGHFIGPFPVEANTTVFVGTIAALNHAGNLLPAADAAGLVVMGRCEGVACTTDEPHLEAGSPDLIEGSDAVNNGAAGAIKAKIRQGIFEWNNSTANPVTEPMTGLKCYVEDDTTVNSTGGTNLVVAGRIVGVSSDGTRVQVDTTRAAEGF